MACLLSLQVVVSFSFQSIYALTRHCRAHKGSIAVASVTSTSGESVNSGSIILRQIDEWACIKNCGACCKLGPLDSRPDLQTYLTPEEHRLYVSMIGPDDWCKHFDKDERLCTIYDSRPNFCRVESTNFQKMYGIEADEFNVTISRLAC